jgi:hypothetical protein
MGTVRCTECIVYEDVTIRGESFRERWVIALFTSMETNVLEQQKLTWSQATHGIVGTNTKCITGRWHVDANKLGESLSCRSKAQPVYHSAVGSTKVRHDHHRRAAVKERLDGWHSGADARVVDDLSVGERHVEVNAKQHALALHVQLANRALP